MTRKRQATLMSMYHSLLAELGPSLWWPAQSAFEVVVGAVLTQNTNWGNVEKALANIRAAGRLNGPDLLALADDELSELIRPSGYHRLKTARLKNVLRFFEAECGFDLEALAQADADELRPRLLAVRGVGPETADSILLYALGLPVFVVDAYTQRMFGRHGLLTEDADYHEIQTMFMDALPGETALYNEYHALIVRAAKSWCRKRDPLCASCPLRTFLE